MSQFGDIWKVENIDRFHAGHGFPERLSQFIYVVYSSIHSLPHSHSKKWPSPINFPRQIFEPQLCCFKELLYNYCKGSRLICILLYNYWFIVKSRDLQNILCTAPNNFKILNIRTREKRSNSLGWLTQIHVTLTDLSAANLRHRTAWHC